MTVVELDEATDIAVDLPALWVVLIDVNFGVPSPEWWVNSEPKSLGEALAEAYELHRSDWITKIEIYDPSVHDDL